MPDRAEPATPRENYRSELSDDGGLRLTLDGPLVAAAIPRAWNAAAERIDSTAPKRLTVDVADVPRADGAGAALLIDLQRRATVLGIPFELTGANDQIRQLLTLYQAKDFLAPPAAPPRETSVIEEIGADTVGLWEDFRDQVAYIGEVFSAVAYTLSEPRRMRWRETLVIAERAGVDALPIVVLLGFLIGLIMSFQAAIPMKQFGVELYVADLISLSMVRELGALITAVVLAGRTGSAFAAELGTMKINEEINALKTLGLDPVRFLVAGRVLASVVTTPLLTLFAIAAGLLGGLVVLLSMDFTAVAYFNEARAMLTLTGFLSGLVKSFVFGFEIAAIGCMRGLQTKSGASAVGQSATSAVVTIIVMLIVTDGIFAVVYYYLGV